MKKEFLEFQFLKLNHLDDTFGVVYVKDLLNLTAPTESVEIESLIKDAIYLA